MTKPTGTRNADGGNISIFGGRRISLTDSEITATVLGGTGNGGNISLSGSSIALNQSNIIAKAEYGDGGNIAITCDTFIKSSDSLISASSRYGNNGTVLINAPVVDYLASLIPILSGTFLSGHDLTPRQCIPKDETEQSTFRISGREGIPPGPDQGE